MVNKLYNIEIFLIYWNFQFGKGQKSVKIKLALSNSSNVSKKLKKSIISKFVTVLYAISLDPYIHYGHTEISSGSKFWYAILIILLIICSTILVWRFWCRRHDKVSGPAVEFMVNPKNLEN